MRKTAIFVAMLGVGAYFVSLAPAAPRHKQHVTKTSRQEGDRRDGLAVLITTASWTAVLSADPRRRSASMQSISSAPADICLSTFTTTAIGCDGSTKGVHLQPGSSYTDFNEQALYGKASGTTVGATVYGLIDYDSADDPNRQ